MGSLHAAEFADAVTEGRLSLDNALRYHLSANHYPPIPMMMVPVCRRAIARAKRGEWDAKVKLPAGVRYRGSNLSPVRALVEHAHLHHFIQEG